MGNVLNYKDATVGVQHSKCAQIDIPQFGYKSFQAKYNQRFMRLGINTDDENDFQVQCTLIVIKATEIVSVQNILKTCSEMT